MIIVYTAIIGGIDDLKIPPVVNPKATYVCLTDNDFRHAGPWESRNVEQVSPNTRRIARYYKVLAHRHFPDARYSIWIDGKTTIAVDPEWAVEQWLRDHDVAFLPHPRYDCIYREAQRCIKQEKEDPKIIKGQMNKYRAEGYPAHNGLVTCSVILRHHTPAIAQLNEFWWREISQYSVRDQLSFNYVAHNLGITWAIIPGHKNQNPYFPHFKHKVKSQ